MTGVFDRSLRGHHLYERSIDAFLRDAGTEVAASRRLHELHSDLIGPFDPSQYAEGLSGLRRWAVRAGRARSIGQVEATILRQFVTSSRLAKPPKAQAAALALARSLEQDSCVRRYVAGR